MPVIYSFALLVDVAQLRHVFQNFLYEFLNFVVFFLFALLYILLLIQLVFVQIVSHFGVEHDFVLHVGQVL